MFAIAHLSFEDFVLRTLLDETGHLRFVFEDLHAALGLNELELSQALDGLNHTDISWEAIPTPDGEVDVTLIDEAGLYRFLSGCQMPVAQRLKTWFTKHFLPSVEKVCEEQAPDLKPDNTPTLQEQIEVLLLVGEFVAQLPGAHPSVVMAATLTAIAKISGLNVSAFKAVLPLDDAAIEI